ncbi:acyl-CoA/acyl-ACP dehydrogenase [Bacillus badius]|uniref:acyl-CoA dehydrogenase family protein n=1 Tax=Bacillus badius TaxID=1455 RepID=UPI001CBB462F|nr:acyl-CoA dehydrogenase family protein [Bacillus badius]UAT32100.1 acyl-CoA/acyl-ACP dehydrogenase [Bacillus badius]
MEFSFNKEQELFRSSVRKYLHSIGQIQVARSFSEGDTVPFKKAWQGLAELGGLAINIPEEHDGAGLGQLDLALILKELGRVLLPGTYLETTSFAVPLINLFGTSEQKQMYLPDIASGTKKASIAWMDHGRIGDRPEDIQLKAEKCGQTFTLTGVKTLVPDGDTADLLIVPVRTSHQGLSIFLLNKESHPWKSKVLESVDETRKLTEVSLEEVAVTSRQMLGPIDQGWSILQQGLIYLNAAIASMMIGSIERVVETAVEYANEREQFGQPIGRFQGIKHKLAEMQIDLELAQSLTYYANWAIDSGSGDCEIAVASARAFATEALIRTASHNIQIHGGIGFTTEVDCHLYLKRARSMENYLGSIRNAYESIAKGLGWCKGEEQPVF